jgi:hypothetical protein
LAAILLCVTLCVLLLSGCDGILKGLGLVPDDESGGGQSEEPVWKGEPVEGKLDDPSIKVKFGVDVNLKETKAVDAAFHELSAFIKKSSLSDLREVIKLGDWIDLDALSVAAYGVETGGEGDYRGYFNENNADIHLQDETIGDYDSKSLRLIVVGINSFWPETGQYSESKNAGVNHVVFQFQNIPVLRRMNETDTNNGGYAKSEMRQYLVKVDGVGGNFLTGLQYAGVPEDVLWAPKRYVSNGGDSPNNADEIVDLLWLPTEREMFGTSYSGEGYPFSATYETTGNQAWLEYYDSDARRYKYFNGDEPDWYWYWESSPYSGLSASFCIVSNVGYTTDLIASSAGGVAPAFCVR